MSRSVKTVEDLLRMLDSLFSSQADRWTDRGSDWWDSFYSDRDRGVPFFRPVPDESLVAWHQNGLLEVPVGGRVLDVGCGPGRNSIWLAKQGYQVDALDLSPMALKWGRELAHEAGVEVNFVRTNIFDWDIPDTKYDLIYDSGCFHHLPPHRRISYLSLLDRSLAPRSSLGLACFAVGGMGSEAPDTTFYIERKLFGGLAYTDDDLRSMFGSLTEIDLRFMHQMPIDSDMFGESFLWEGPSAAQLNTIDTKRVHVSAL